MKLFTLIFISLFSIVECKAQLTATGAYLGPPGFSNGFQATSYCGNNPESWVRGSAFMNTQTGLLTMQIDLETDATHAGPKGQVFVYVYDKAGNLLSRVVSVEVGRGGKPPGGAARSTYQSSINLGPAIANRAKSMTVVANCTGSIDRWFNIPFEAVENAFAIFFF